jgi:hypothetical protein
MQYAIPFMDPESLCAHEAQPKVPSRVQNRTMSSFQLVLANIKSIHSDLLSLHLTPGCNNIYKLCTGAMVMRYHGVRYYESLSHEFVTTFALPRCAYFNNWRKLCAWLLLKTWDHLKSCQSWSCWRLFYSQFLSTGDMFHMIMLPLSKQELFRLMLAFLCEDQL